MGAVKNKFQEPQQKFSFIILKRLATAILVVKIINSYVNHVLTGLILAPFVGVVMQWKPCPPADIYNMWLILRGRYNLIRLWDFLGHVRYSPVLRLHLPLKTTENKGIKVETHHVVEMLKGSFETYLFGTIISNARLQLKSQRTYIDLYT